MLCPHCSEQVKLEATRCSHCTGEMQSSMGSMVDEHGFMHACKIALMMLIFFVIIGIGIAYWNTNDIKDAFYYGSIGGAALTVMCLYSKVKEAM